MSSTYYRVDYRRTVEIGERQTDGYESGTLHLLSDRKHYLGFFDTASLACFQDMLPFGPSNTMRCSVVIMARGHLKA
jgi:hypothetical protein